MIDFEAVEPALLTLLAPLNANGILVRALPNRSNEQGAVGDGFEAVITVALASIKPADRVSLDAHIQARNYRIVFDCRARNLRGVSGLYSLPRQLEQALQAQRVEGLGRLEFEDYEFLERNAKEDYWGAVVRFKVRTIDRL